MANIQLLIGKDCKLIFYGDRDGATECVGRDPPQGLKIVNLLGRFEIFSCLLGRQSVDGLDEYA